MTLFSQGSVAKWTLSTICLILFLLVFQNTFILLVNTWFESTTFEHSFLIAPIAIWLIYRKQAELSNATIKPAPLLLGVVGGLSLLWLVGTIVGINALSQFSLLSIPLVAIWAFYGFDFVKIIRFPLFFLILSVPFGEFLIPNLQEITADLTVFFLQLVNVPIYREGLYLYIPEGTFHVAEACSGIRFLFSTITLGLLITHLQIKSRKRQFIFMLSVCLIPIIANGLRAFMIVFIGHVSDMQAAVGFDHIVYGWVFFCIVIILVVLLGNRISDVEGHSSASTTASEINISAPKPLLLIAFLCSVCIGPAISSIYHYKLNAFKESAVPESKQLSTPYKTNLGWHPIFPQADAVSIGPDTKVIQYVIQYDFEDETKELISWENRLYDPELWTIKSNSYHSLEYKDVNVPYRHIVVVNSLGVERNIFITYKVANAFFSNELKIKVFQLYSKLTFTDFGGKALISSTLVRDDMDPTEVIKKIVDYNSRIEN
ncbi:exosortase A [Paraglaciecola aquimarina]|uniref:Exosortase A n=1 Tax=Paraglaciecola aquimarina TaxID=1235557 RepID=A0ABU3T294_9ALTE|nr:exosortase A [Paraglaciecola aquimarina]MDU0356381.1 exosortase A [Paraglaciecola aquimarina]